MPDVRVGRVRALHGCDGRPVRLAPDAPGGRSGAHGLLRRVRRAAGLPPDARADGGARRVLVGRADRVGGLHDWHPPANAAGRRHRVLGPRVRGRAGRRTNHRLLALSVRLVHAVRGHGRAEPRRGRRRLAAAEGAAAPPAGEVRRPRPTHRVARPRALGHADALLVQLRRHHEFRRDVWGGQRIDAERPLSDRRRLRDHRHEAVSRPDCRPRRVRSAARAVPRRSSPSGWSCSSAAAAGRG